MTSGNATSGWMTLEEAANELGLHPRSVMKMCHDQKIGKRMGGGWLVATKEVKSLLRSSAKKNRPIKVNRVRSDLLSPVQVAEKLQVHERWARQLFIDGKIGFKVGSRWVATKLEVSQFAREYKKTKGIASSAKLTPRQVDYIRRHDGISTAKLAKKYNVDESTIWRVRKKQTWKDGASE